MTPLERKKKEVELGNVKNARENLELRIMEREDEIQRIKDNIKIQVDTETRLSKELAGE